MWCDLLHAAEWYGLCQDRQQSHSGQRCAPDASVKIAQYSCIAASALFVLEVSLRHVGPASFMPPNDINCVESAGKGLHRQCYECIKIVGDAVHMLLTSRAHCKELMCGVLKVSVHSVSLLLASANHPCTCLLVAVSLTLQTCQPPTSPRSGTCALCCV